MAMRTDSVTDEARQLLRRLAAGDEPSLEMVLWPGAASRPALLDTRTRLLVRLAALLAMDASTESLRWAVDLASAAGADDEAVAAVLIVSGHTAGSAQLAKSAARLASALGIEAGDDDAATRLRLLPEQPGVRGARDGL
jgi:4-carboxymuconolactone decarboxylase